MIKESIISNKKIDNNITQKESRKILKQAIGFFILLVGILLIPMHLLNIFVNLEGEILASISLIILGILIMVGTNKFKIIKKKR